MGNQAVLATKWMTPSFWNNKKVFVTGHTGFKGSWLCLWLHSLGASVTGYALQPPTEPSLYKLCKLDEWVTSHTADIRNPEQLTAALAGAAPDIVIHMAAQPLVRKSYEQPAETYEVNMMGTVNLLEAVRKAVQSGVPVRAVLNVTTDKCYQNQEWTWGYRETDQLGGSDPYSSSKACSELITSGYREAYFPSRDYSRHQVAVATARAGNVIGGGDWAKDRLIPDCMRALLQGEKIKLRYPQAVRPWQHVLEPVSGYLMLAKKLFEQGPPYAEEWNFGPNDCDVLPVADVVRKMCDLWGGGSAYEVEEGVHPRESQLLMLDCSKAKQKLGWYPEWNLDTALAKTVEWVKAYEQQNDMRAICLRQIQDYRKEG